MEPLPNKYAWFIERAWIAELVAALALLFLLDFLMRRSIRKSKQKAQLKENDWRIHLEPSVIFPIRIFLWIVILSFFFQILGQELKMEENFLFISPIRNAGIVLCVGWFLLRWKRVFHNAMAARRVKGKLSFDPVFLEISTKLFTLAILFVSLLIILGLFGINVLPLVTFGGIGAAALGYAGKDVIANFCGGLMLYVTRPFTTNDLIEVPEQKIYGYVEEIGWYLTSIRDLQKKPLYIPNAFFSTHFLINHSRITHRRIEETLAIRYADAPKAKILVEEIREFLEHHLEIDHHQPINVYLLTFGPYALEVEIKAYTLSTRYEEFMEIKQKILLQIHALLEKNGLDLVVMPSKF